MNTNIIDSILAHEGGFANYSHDSGGMTYKGITKRYFPRFEGWKIIDSVLEDYPELKEPYTSSRPLKDSLSSLNRELQDNLSLQNEIYAFYDKYFYQELMLDKVESDNIKITMMHCGVLSGKKNSVKIAQICSGSTVDKIIGNNTISNINSSDEKAFLFQYYLEFLEHFTYLAFKSKNYEKSLKGWNNRVFNLYKDYVGGD